jgi:hypothetical protein
MNATYNNAYDIFARVKGHFLGVAIFIITIAYFVIIRNPNFPKNIFGENRKANAT